MNRKEECEVDAREDIAPELEAEGAGTAEEAVYVLNGSRAARLEVPDDQEAEEAPEDAGYD